MFHWILELGGSARGDENPRDTGCFRYWNLYERCGVCRMNEIIDPKELAGKLKAFWSPRIVAEVDDAFVKVAKIKGDFEWHSHANEDEMFMVLDGEMRIEMEDRTVNLCAGELFVVPRGKRHRPVAAEECLILLFERKSTEHMGELVRDQTRTVADQWIQE